MPFVEIAESQFHEGGRARIRYREFGSGFPLIFLHSGWGHEVYAFDRQIANLGSRFRILIPDRSGYGASEPIAQLPIDFHARAVAETFGFLDALRIERAVFWGHSDGAVIAALAALEQPARVAAVILEAFHYAKVKAGSVDFFHAMISEPDSIGARTVSALERDHGVGWRQVLERNASAWLKIVAAGGGDLYGGRLSELPVPTLFIQGGRDPRTEPGDMEAIRRELPAAQIRILDGAGHSPHSESAAAEECSRVTREFLDAAIGGVH
jgi:pimeloyl-ACP methyl ester carboxylesterase